MSDDSEGGAGKRRRVEVALTAAAATPPLAPPPSELVFALPSLVHAHVAPHFRAHWGNHWALARVTARMYRYYRDHDESVRWMHHVFCARNAGLPRRLKFELVLESALPLCLDWLWYRECTRICVGELAKEFVWAGARHGSEFIMARYAPLVSPEDAEATHLRALAHMCEGGHDALALRKCEGAPPHLLSGMLERAARFAHRAPHCFDHLYEETAKMCPAGAALPALCLVSACDTPRFDATSFQYLWERFVPRDGGSGAVKTFVATFLDTLFVMYMRHAHESGAMDRVAMALPRIARTMFAPYSQFSGGTAAAAAAAGGTTRQVLEFTEIDVRGTRMEPFRVTIDRGVPSAHGEVHVVVLCEQAHDAFRIRLPMLLPHGCY